MFARWTIRKKLQMTMIVLGMVITVLGYSSFRGVYAYKELAASLSVRAAEIPITSELTRVIDELRIDFENQPLPTQELFRIGVAPENSSPESEFLRNVQRVREVLASYKSRLENTQSSSFSRTGVRNSSKQLASANCSTRLHGAGSRMIP
jgi:two-component system NtrC family sensor kinase